MPAQSTRRERSNCALVDAAQLPAVGVGVAEQKSLGGGVAGAGHVESTTFIGTFHTPESKQPVKPAPAIAYGVGVKCTGKVNM